MSLDEKPVEFTKEMAKTHTILAPNMLPVHFAMLEQILKCEGYNVEILKTEGRPIIEEGLKNVHNDMCYPALLVIGQMINALKSGKYDPDKTALLITQTGGGCRASNYISLLRKALKQSGYGNVPVISLNFSNLESNSGFSVSLKMIIQSLYAIIYGDMIMWISNQCKPYELNKGETQKKIDYWTNELCSQLHSTKFLHVKKNYKKILDDFASIPRSDEQKPRVGIVGEIYMKYSPLGNSRLEEFLIKEGAEPVLSGLLDFILYCLRNTVTDHALYGNALGKKLIGTIGLKYFTRWQNKMIKAVEQHGVFRSPTTFRELESMTDGFISKGAKMGEGWLLTAEMLELIHSGVNNIVCTQPFGCLPNHIIAKGKMKLIKDKYPNANIVAVDYDPSATAINQENRLKLMLSNAKLNEKQSAASKKQSKTVRQSVAEAAEV